MCLTKRQRTRVFAAIATGCLLSTASPFHSQDGPATATPIVRGIALALDAAGNVFVLDGNRVRKAGTDGTIKTVAGSGVPEHRGDGGPATEAGFVYPTGIAVDSTGNLYIADNLGHRVRKVTPAGIITTVAGTGEPGWSGDGGPAASARLQSPVRVAADAAGNLYIADNGNTRIRRINPSGAISTIAGTGKAGFRGDGGPAAAAQIDVVTGLGVDSAGNVYIADAGNARIRKVTARGVISTIAGTGKAGFSGDGAAATAAEIDPFNLAVDAAGNVYVVEINRVRRIGTDGAIRTVAGDGTAGFNGDGGRAIAAQLRGPTAVALDNQGNLFIADALNGRIRKVAGGAISVVAGTAIPLPSPTPVTLTSTSATNVAVGLLIPPPPQVGNVPILPSALPGQRGVIGQTQQAPVAPNNRPAMLQTRMQSLAPSAKDCGHTPRDSASTVVSCVDAAVRGKTAFVASFIQTGIDSTVVLGLAAAADGTPVQLFYDSGANEGAGRVSTPRDCATPQLNASGPTVRLNCN